MAAHRAASGREQHTHKITVYLSADELFDLEHARLALRRYGITADRGRLVREALAVVLADLDARGESSVLARRIAAQPYADGAGPNGGPGAPSAGPSAGLNGGPSAGLNGGPSAGLNGGGGGHDG